MAYEPVTDLAVLNAAYGEPGAAAMLKVATRITPAYRRLIEASPFLALASAGPEGLDCSPRGEFGGLLRILDSKTLAIPDRRGNNRVDTLANIVRDPRVALLFLIPGSHTTVRLNGRAIVTFDAGLRATFEKDGKLPRSVVVISVAEIYTQCGRAVIRADLWNPAQHVAKEMVPTPGGILAEQSSGEFDGETYDAQWPGRAAETMW